MKVGFHYHIPMVEREGVLYTSGFFGVFLDSLAEQVSELVCFMHTPLPGELFKMDYALTSPNVRHVSIGDHVSVPKRLLRARRIVKEVQSELGKIDILLIRCPTPMLPAFARSKKIKKAFLIVGDYEKSSKDLIQPFFRKKAIELWATFNKWQQDRAIKESIVFVNNALIFNELQDRIKKLFLIRTTTLQKTDFFFREDTCLGETINLLYVGRLDLSKGLLEMIESLGQVRAKGINAKLHFVGWEDKNMTIVSDKLKRYAEALGLENFVFNHGKKTIGEELNSYYRMADIYLIGSKLNEGFPRTIWEAFAKCLPVVASKVGSIPLFLNHKKEAYLTEPGSVSEMTDAILELIANSELRKRQIQNGLEMAKETTLEIQAKKMIDILSANPLKD